MAEDELTDPTSTVLNCLENCESSGLRCFGCTAMLYCLWISAGVWQACGVVMMFISAEGDEPVSTFIGSHLLLLVIASLFLKLVSY